MGMQEAWKQCSHCGANVRAAREVPNHVLHFLLTVVTAGLWLVIWLAKSIQFGGWRCTQCGNRIGASGTKLALVVGGVLLALILLASLAPQPPAAPVSPGAPAKSAHALPTGKKTRSP